MDVKSGKVHVYELLCIENNPGISTITKITEAPLEQLREKHG